MQHYGICQSWSAIWTLRVQSPSIRPCLYLQHSNTACLLSWMQELMKSMGSFGFDILQALVNDIQPAAKGMYRCVMVYAISCFVATTRLVAARLIFADKLEYCLSGCPLPHCRIPGHRVCRAFLGANSVYGKPLRPRLLRPRSLPARLLCGRAVRPRSLWRRPSCGWSICVRSLFYRWVILC